MSGQNRGGKSIRTPLLHTVRSLFREYIVWLIVLLAAIWGLSGIFRVENDQMAVVTRFGKVVRTSVPPGLHYRFPRPVESDMRENVREVKTVILDTFSLKYWEQENEATDFFKRTGLEPYLITGDDYIVAGSILIKYNIVDIARYRFTVRDGERLLRRIASSVLIEEIASMRIDDILTTRRKIIGFNLKKELQTELDALGAGITVAFVEIRELVPPVSVQPYFDRVVNAEVEKDQMLDQAESYRHKTHSDARSDADTMIQKAHGYGERTLLEAQGRAERFSLQLSEYRKNPALNRHTIYRNKIQSIFKSVSDIRIIDGAGKGSGFFPVRFR